VKLTIVSGSHRARSQSGKVARFLQECVKKHANGFDSIYLLDLASTRLPLWDDDINMGPQNDHPWAEISAQFRESQAFIFVAPEWSGMVPPGLKNLLLFCTRNELTHKPALIVTISASMGGAYPVAELRATSSKNTKVCYIPEHVVIRRVNTVLNGPEPQDDYDDSIRLRIQHSVRVLLEYAKALATVRGSGVIDDAAFQYGM
jgi:NAD(P)H-dependent FMN reductase